MSDEPASHGRPGFSFRETESNAGYDDEFENMSDMSASNYYNILAKEKCLQRSDLLARVKFLETISSRLICSYVSSQISRIDEN